LSFTKKTKQKEGIKTKQNIKEFKKDAHGAHKSSLLFFFYELLQFSMTTTLLF